MPNDENGEVTGRTTTAVYSEATQYLCGDPTPKLYGGFGTSVDFYGFDASVAFTYSIGGLTYDSGYAGYMGSPLPSSAGSNYHKDILKAWTPDNKDSNIPRFQYQDQYSAATSDRFLVDAYKVDLSKFSKDDKKISQSNLTAISYEDLTKKMETTQVTDGD